MTESSQYSTLTPPGFTDINSVDLKTEQLTELLNKVIEKIRNEPQFIEQQPKQIDLLISVAQLTLLPTPISSEDKRTFLNNILTIGQDLLTDNNNKATVLSSDTSNTDPDGDLSLDDLAKEYLQNQPTPSSLNEKQTTIGEKSNDIDGDFSLDDLANEYLRDEATPSSNDKPPTTTSSESDDIDLNVDNISKNCLSSSPTIPVTNVLSNIVFPTPPTEPMIVKPLLETILFSNRLSSHDAADDADCIWKEESSLFGKMFCQKSDDAHIAAETRIATCLLDRSLYERLTRLIALLPKQCIRNSVQQLSIRPNEQNRPPHQRPNNNNNNNRRPPTHRPSFQDNANAHSMPRHPLSTSSQNQPRSYMNANYSNQPRDPNGNFADRRPQGQGQQQNRYPPSSYAPYPTDQQQYQQKGGPKNNSYNNGYQQKKKPPTNNQQGPNQNQQRGPKKGFGGSGGGGGGANSGPSGASSNTKPK